MSNLHKLIRARIQRELDSGKTQMEIASQCGVGQGTIYKYLNSEPKPDFGTILKFSKGLGVPIGDMVAAETHAPYKPAAPPSEAQVPSHMQRLLDLARHLDRDELATLERCASAFRADEPEVRQHLIGQLKIVERLVNLDQSAGGAGGGKAKKHSFPM